MFLRHQVLTWNDRDGPVGEVNANSKTKSIILVCAGRSKTAYPNYRSNLNTIVTSAQLVTFSIFMIKENLPLEKLCIVGNWINNLNLFILLVNDTD